MILTIDLETYSPQDIGKVGAYRYAQDPDFEILLCSAAVDDGRVQLTDTTDNGNIGLAALKTLLFAPCYTKRAWNAAFEWWCLSEYFHLTQQQREDWLDQWQVIRVHAMYCGLPACLKMAAQALLLPECKAKMMEGAALIRYCCCPCKPTKTNGGRTRNLPEHDPEKWKIFRQYNIRDVETERHIDNLLEPFTVPDFIWQQWRDDVRMTSRGSAPGARGVVQEKQVTAATAAALLKWLKEDSNYIPLQTRESFDETATPAQRAATASAQSPQLLLSIHGNSAANGSTAAGFECYPAVPGRTWHQESFYFAKLLAGGMQSIGARLRGRGGVRYIYYLENDQKQLEENTYTQVRPERSFTLLEDVDCPAVLAEQCFVTNAEDVERFGSEESCKTVARIYYEAICAYFGTEPLPVK